MPLDDESSSEDLDLDEILAQEDPLKIEQSENSEEKISEVEESIGLIEDESKAEIIMKKKSSAEFDEEQFETIPDQEIKQDEEKIEGENSDENKKDFDDDYFEEIEFDDDEDDSKLPSFQIFSNRSQRPESQRRDNYAINGPMQVKMPTFNYSLNGPKSLSTQNVGNVERGVNLERLDYLFKFLEPEIEKNEVLVAYFCKFVTSLMEINQVEMVRYFYSKRTIFQNFMQNLQFRGISDLLSQFLNYEKPAYFSEEIVNEIAKNLQKRIDIFNMLIGKLSTEENERDVVENIETIFNVFFEKCSILDQGFIVLKSTFLDEDALNQLIQGFQTSKYSKISVCRILGKLVKKLKNEDQLDQLVRQIQENENPGVALDSEHKKKNKEEIVENLGTILLSIPLKEIVKKIEDDVDNAVYGLTVNNIGQETPRLGYQNYVFFEFCLDLIKLDNIELNFQLRDSKFYHVLLVSLKILTNSFSHFSKNSLGRILFTAYFLKSLRNVLRKMKHPLF